MRQVKDVTLNANCGLGVSHNLLAHVFDCLVARLCRPSTQHLLLGLRPTV